MRKDTRRLFFALDLAADDNTNSREAIIALKAQLSPLGRPVPDDNLHITLAFLGEVDAEAYRTLCATADTITQPAFSLSTTTTGQFPKQGILWLGVTPDTSLHVLASELQAAAAEILSRPAEHRFVPHISLLRRVNAPEPSHALTVPLTFHQFGLYASVPAENGRGVQHQCLNRWTLGD